MRDPIEHIEEKLKEAIGLMTIELFETGGNFKPAIAAAEKAINLVRDAWND